MAGIIRITESQYRRVFSLITEDKEGKNMAKARRVVSSINPGADAMDVITKIRNDIPNSRINQCKFLPGVTRMFMVGQIADAKTIFGINATLEVIGTYHDNEYDGDLNGETAQGIIAKFRDELAERLAVKKKESASGDYGDGTSDYEIVKVPSFEKAGEYAKYTSWCVTQTSHAYNNYTHDGIGIFYFLLKHGFENVECVPGEGCPRDEYGMSMIAVSINEDGSVNTTTCRWNHDNGANDNMFTDKEISSLIGRDMYTVLKPRQVEILFEDDRFKIFKRDNGDDKVLCYNKKLKRTTTFDDDGTAEFVGIVPFRDYNVERRGRVDMNGNVIMPAIYELTRPFESDGCTTVIYHDDNTSEKRIIRKDGKIMARDVNYVSKPTSGGARVFYSGTYPVVMNAMLDKYTKIGELKKVGASFDWDDRVIVVTNDGEEGLLNDDLTWAIPPGTFSCLETMVYSDKCRLVFNEYEKNGMYFFQYGLINENCEVLLPIGFRFISSDVRTDEDKRHYRAVCVVERGKRTRGKAFRMEDGSMVVEWENGEKSTFHPRKIG